MNQFSLKLVSEGCWQVIIGDGTVSKKPSGIVMKKPNGRYLVMKTKNGQWGISMDECTDLIEAATSVAEVE